MNALYHRGEPRWDSRPAGSNIKEVGRTCDGATMRIDTRIEVYNGWFAFTAVSSPETLVSRRAR